MKKKHLVVVGVIILSTIVILGLYQTFALSGDITKDTSGYYNVTITDGTTVTVPAGSTKTVYYKLTNTNKGIVKYGIGYSGTNITVKYYNDTQDPVTGTVDYGKSKYIKLSVQNSGTTSSTATLSTILGYEKGGDLIVPTGVTLVTEGYTGPINYIITNLYSNATKTSVTNNSITYQYDTTHSLMKDIDGNIRYYGASPNNYIYFNCSDYSNQSASTCETWRIIGVFNGKVKLIRGRQIGTLSWDNKNTSTGAESDNGKNDWSDARLMKLLNPGYESETVGGSLYYNAKSGNCYSGQNNATTTCNLTSVGLKNATTRSLISEEVWTLRNYHDSFNISGAYANTAYEQERSKGDVYNGRPTEWTGKIALAYPSDYGYAANLARCIKQLGYYNDSTCTSNNWMKAILGSSRSTWLLSPLSDSTDGGVYIRSNGSLSIIYSYNEFWVAPALYLNADTNIKSGAGSSSDPYQLSA